MILEDFIRYWHLLWRDVPHNVLESLVVVFCIGTVTLLALKGLKSGWRYVSGLLLAEYVFLLYCSTVIFRSASSLREYDFIPFWSYRAYFSGEDRTLLAENIMNIAVFIPVGLLLGLTFRSMSWLHAILIGACLSVGIEVLQFAFVRGFAEFDDVMHNTLGCVMGYGLFRLLLCGCQILWRRNRNNNTEYYDTKMVI